MSKQKIKYIATDLPGLQSGQYQLSAQQTLAIDGHQQALFQASQEIAVSGERFGLNPQEIYTVFPANNSQGDHSHTLPHVVLNRSTHPWEWSMPEVDDTMLPWMAVILLQEDEHPVGVIEQSSLDTEFPSYPGLWAHLIDHNWIQPLTSLPSSAIILMRKDREELDEAYVDIVSQLKKFLNKRCQEASVPLSILETSPTVGSGIDWPRIYREPFEAPDNKTRIIHLPKDFFLNILPSGAELALLSHVRQPIIASAGGKEIPTGQSRSVIIGNRMPIAGKTSTAYLISLEKRLHDDGSFRMTNTESNGLVRLVVLHSWSFHCLESNRNFENALQELNLNHRTESNTLRLPPQPDATNLEDQAKVDAINAYLSQGYVPLKHQMREGNTTFSWYRGPLIPVHSEAQIAPPSKDRPLIQHADELKRFDSYLNMLDVSYSSAWELGRMLMLKEKDVSFALHQWKHQHALSIRQGEEQLVYQFLPIQAPTDSLSFPENVQTYFNALRLCQHIPFVNLVPDKRLLPAESLRFFQIDELWMESLLDGAYSIGRMSYANQILNRPVSTGDSNAALSGFLLRSHIVAEWPGLQVDAYADTPPLSNPDQQGLTSLQQLRMEKLSNNVLLVLFKGIIGTVDFHLHPESIHFGFDPNPAFTPESESESEYVHFLRDVDGSRVETSTGGTFPIDWKEVNGNLRVLNINSLGTNIELAAQAASKTISIKNSAELAYQLTEGIPNVRFIREG
ncbi:MAG: hypothetical protein AAF587_29945 [Bacteroidota bacterium]